MGSAGQLRFVEQYAGRFEGPFLEAGSRDYGNTQDLRSLFAGEASAEYLGVDMVDGPGVDVAADLAQDFEKVDKILHGRRFGTIFCLSVLEHCQNPFAMAKNLQRLLRPGGTLCISAPFAFRLHAYPDDFWRFTPSGIRKLFDDIEFPEEDSFWMTGRSGEEFRPVDRNLGKIPFSLSAHWRGGHRLRGLSAKMLGILGRCGPLGWLAGYRYVLAPTDIIMVGTLRRETR